MKRRNHKDTAMKSARSFRAGVCAAALFAFSSAGHAACCVFDAASIVASVNAASSAIVSAIATSSQWTASQVTASVVGAQAATSATIRETGALNASATVRSAATMERSRQDERYRLTDPCSVAAPTAGLSQVFSGASAAVAGAAVGRGGEQGSRVGASRTMAKALDTAQGTARAPAPEVAAQVAAQGACESFAAPGSVRAALCSGAGFRPSSSAGLQNADIRSDTIMDGPQGADKRKRYSIDLGGSDGMAVGAFMRNINTPVMLRDLEPGELATDEGRRYMALKDAYEARMSLAERPARRHVAQIAATTATIPFVETLLKGQDAAFVTSYLSDFAPNWKSKGISADEVMNLEVRRRYLNPAWQARMAEASPEEASKEHLQVAALQSVLLWNLVQEMREVGVASGATALAQTRAELIPQLTAQHRAAAR